MPLIKVQSSASITDSNVIQDLLKSLSSKMAQHFGKPESYVMTMFEANINMTFGGTFEPVCYIEVKNIGTMKPEQTKAISQDFCHQIQEKLDVPINRIYIEFTDAQRHLWGWNGGTF
ncbi:MAG TPA: hypothetical protein DCF68_00325 [Cyanothece sp. UBA12306]|nr:hypothetical protein [Cyanothece sp. UBA12306]